MKRAGLNQQFKRLGPLITKESKPRISFKKKQNPITSINDNDHNRQHLKQFLDSYLYGISHDLQAPLRATHNLIQLIGTQPEDKLSYQSQKILELVKQKNKSMRLFINDMLAYYLSRANNVSTLVNTRELLQKVIHMLEVPEGFTFKFASPLPLFCTAQAPLFQVFHNLLNNAIKHHHDPAKGVVLVTWQEVGSFIEFSVRDNGPGISEEYHQKIFELLQRLPSKDHKEGNGLGLALAKQLVELQGGKIKVVSLVGKGSIFKFTWPYRQGTLRTTQEQKSSNSFSKKA